MKGNRIPAIMRKKRNPAMSDEEIKASSDAAAADFKEEVDPNKPTISYREIDPNFEQKLRERDIKLRMLRERKAKDKLEYDRMKKEKGW